MSKGELSEREKFQEKLMIYRSLEGRLDSLIQKQNVF